VGIRAAGLPCQSMPGENDKLALETERSFRAEVKISVFNKSRRRVKPGASSVITKGPRAIHVVEVGRGLGLGPL